MDGIWGKLRAHFGSGATWMDLLYLFAKLVLGTISFTLLVVGGVDGRLVPGHPVLRGLDVPIINGTWVPPLWFGVLAVPLGILTFFVSLHVLNGWGWVCARWAEVMFRGSTAAPAAQLVPPATGVPAGPRPQPSAVQGPPQPPARRAVGPPPQAPAAPATPRAGSPATAAAGSRRPRRWGPRRPRSRGSSATAPPDDETSRP